MTSTTTSRDECVTPAVSHSGDNVNDGEDEQPTVGTKGRRMSPFYSCITYKCAWLERVKDANISSPGGGSEGHHLVTSVNRNQCTKGKVSRCTEIPSRIQPSSVAHRPKRGHGYLQ